MLKSAMNWRKILKSRVKVKEPLKRHTTFKIGGPADFFVYCRDIPGLRAVLGFAKKNKIRALLIGGGSNILASDKGVKAMVIKLDGPYFKKISFKRDTVIAGSALGLNQLSFATSGQGLRGLEFLAGIPGTVGGALLMNAGAWQEEIADYLVKIEVMDYNGKVKSIARKNIKFGYRTSNLSKYIILSSVFRLSKGDIRQAKAKIRAYLEKRRSIQDLSLPSAGSVFKNPKAGCSAGRLIDLCGLKGRRIGKAAISSKHANFILNKKDARAQDVVRLMNLARKEVRRKFKVNLEPEIKIW